MDNQDGVVSHFGVQWVLTTLHQSKHYEMLHRSSVMEWVLSDSMPVRLFVPMDKEVSMLGKYGY